MLSKITIHVCIKCQHKLDKMARDGKPLMPQTLGLLNLAAMQKQGVFFCNVCGQAPK